jgi:cytochrome o ubiquinol oxidase subunit 2
MLKRMPKRRPGSLARAIVLLAAALTLCYTLLIRGHNVAVLNPHGWVAQQQMNLNVLASLLLLLVALPTVAVLFFFAWNYRESNTKATHDPKFQAGKPFLLAAWGIPIVFMSAMSVVMWTETHRLVPQQAIAASAKPMTVEVVALRWKWLFIYPEQHIATVNFVQIPTNTPVTGHINNLNLMATTPGDYQGSTSEINGAGLANMKFTTRASSQGEFDYWVANSQQSTEVLDEAEYSRLLKPSEANPPRVYSSYEHGLYANVLMKYTHDMAGMDMK